MKLIRSNGLYLEVRDVGPVVMRLEPNTKKQPLPIMNGVVDDDYARDFLRGLLDTRHFHKVQPEGGPR